MKKVILAAEAREAAAKAKKALKDRKNILSGGGLPGKLMDCTTRDRDEIGAVPRRGRLRRRLGRQRPRPHYQADPAAARQGAQRREGPRSEKVLDNEEICSLISAIGVDIGNTEDIEQAALRQDHHPDRRRRGRPAHPHAAADVLLPPDAQADRGRATSTSPGRRCSR